MFGRVPMDGVHMPDVSLAELPVQVALALSLASSSTGADYDYLLKTAQRESSFRSDAKATTSSAEGLFQFIDETWIRTVKDEGPALGLAGYADKITKTDEGRYVIANAKDRDAILDLRRDPKISALMAGAFSRRNEERLAAGIGRAPTSGELYIAHLLGAGDASRLIRIRGVDMSIAAADLFPRAAAANRALFYRSGKALSAGELYDRLIALHAHRPKIAIKDDGAVSGDVAFGSWKADVARRIVFTKEEAAKLGWAYLNDLAQREPSVFGWGRKSSRKVAPQDVGERRHRRRCRRRRMVDRRGSGDRRRGRRCRSRQLGADRRRRRSTRSNGESGRQGEGRAVRQGSRR